MSKITQNEGQTPVKADDFDHEIETIVRRGVEKVMTESNQTEQEVDEQFRQIRSGARGRSKRFSI